MASILAAVLSLQFARAQAHEAIVHAVSFPKGDAAWSVKLADYKRPDGRDGKIAVEPPASLVVKKVKIVRKGGLRRDVVTYLDNSESTYWWVEKSGIILWKKGDEPVQAMRSGFFGAQRFDESFFSWVNEKTFRGMEKFQGEDCRHYHIEVPSVDGDVMAYDAWIDNKSQKPVAWNDGGVPRIFSMDESIPEEPLSLSTSFQDVLARCEAALAPKRKLGRQQQ